MNSDWTATDLSRALGEGTETDLSRALADLSVLALSARAEAQGEDWDASWDDALMLGCRLRAVIEANDGAAERHACELG
ncbi:hypothetical protein PFZ49_02010 [Microbacterium lacticum]|uniref:hypothetical protein n=1 Tax=Microbacterium lacticum TaxID=33885 RepID=UPI003A85EFF8